MVEKYNFFLKEILFYQSKSHISNILIPNDFLQNGHKGYNLYKIFYFLI